MIASDRTSWSMLLVNF